MAWAKLKGVEKPFPLPEVLCFVGYTLILILDKMLVDKNEIIAEEINRAATKNNPIESEHDV